MILFRVFVCASSCNRHIMCAFGHVIVAKGLAQCGQRGLWWRAGVGADHSGVCTQQMMELLLHSVAVLSACTALFENFVRVRGDLKAIA